MSQRQSASSSTSSGSAESTNTTSKNTSSSAAATQPIRTIKDIVDRPIVCRSPDHELVVYPRWIVFYSESAYKKPSYAKFFIENRDKYPVVYNIKSRTKLFRLGTSSAGILNAGEKRTIKLYLLSCDEWPLGINDYVQKPLKIAIENLRIPSNIQPENQIETASIARHIWRKSMDEWPLERLYTKISIGIEKCESTANATPVTSQTSSVK